MIKVALLEQGDRPANPRLGADVPDQHSARAARLATRYTATGTLAAVDVYDPATNTWSLGPDRPTTPR